MIRIGHVLDAIKFITDNSISLCCTSPPYYGLRNYGIPPVVWGGDSNCEHSWQTVFTPNQNAGGGITHKQETNRGSYSTEQVRDGGPLPRKIEGARGHTSGFCECGAWLGCLGLEPVASCNAWAKGLPPCSSCYVCHMRSIFAEVWRVLHPSGSLWLNLGSSYAGSGGGEPYRRTSSGKMMLPQERASSIGLPAKNLIMIPQMVALALQADGWILRSELPWIKGSSMPQSVTDRPSTAHEHFFLLAKRPNYYYDMDAVRMPFSDASMPQLTGAYTGQGQHEYEANGVQNPSDVKRRTMAAMAESGGRSRRTTDTWNESLDREIESARKWLRHLETIRGRKGLLCDEDGDPLAVNVNPKPKPSGTDHYATYCGDLIRPMLKSGTSEVGCCAECGAPWRRTVDRVIVPPMRRSGTGLNPDRNDGGMACKAERTFTTTGWAPTCSHNAETVPCRILDPFLGSGTTALVAMELGRDWVGIEASEEYAAIAQRRIDAARLQTRLFTPAETVGAAVASPVQRGLFDAEEAA